MSADEKEVQLDKDKDKDADKAEAQGGRPRRSVDSGCSGSSTRSDAGQELPPSVLARNKEYGDADLGHAGIEAVVPGHEFDLELGKVIPQGEKKKVITNTW